ncbi:MAG TPA: acetone carboxylase subunit gamma, partial [Gammaproteobacteria bacterium]|nr:acetone carboxylase subunit gamma [Gammaproteobacteria bacterium]
MADDTLSSQEVTNALMNRDLAWPELVKLMREPKSENRFDEMIAAVQAMVPWKEKILLPLGENLFIVAKKGKAIIKTMGGAELCAWNENWKMKCRVRIRKTKAELNKIFPPEHMTIDPNL